jgi:hypothetical protein
VGVVVEAIRGLREGLAVRLAVGLTVLSAVAISSDCSGASSVASSDQQIVMRACHEKMSIDCADLKSSDFPGQLLANEQ